MVVDTRVAADTRVAVDTRAAVDTRLVEEAEDVEAVSHTLLAVVMDTGAEVDILMLPDKRQPDILEGVAT
jgi:hypothetical protein